MNAVQTVVSGMQTPDNERSVRVYRTTDPCAIGAPPCEGNAFDRLISVSLSTLAKELLTRSYFFDRGADHTCLLSNRIRTNESYETTNRVIPC